MLHKQADKRDIAVREFETAERLNPNLAAPHFQLYNLYRQSGRAADAARELAIFQKLKALTEGAAIPEDMEWSYYAEIYDPIVPRPESDPAAPTPLARVPTPASGPVTSNVHIGKVNCGAAAQQALPQPQPDSALYALTTIAGYYGIAADPSQLAHDLGLGHRAAGGRRAAATAA